MSSMDPMKVDSSILSETLRRTSLRPFRLHQLLNTKSSSLMRQTTQQTTYNSSYGQVLRSLVATVDSSSPATTRIESSNPSIPDAPSSSLESKEKTSKPSPPHSSSVSGLYLEAERVEYDPKVIAQLVNKHFPDWRRVLNECQRYSVSGKIDSGILASFSDVPVNELIKDLKNKNFSEVRKWVVSNLDNDSGVLLRRIYDALYDSLVPGSIPAAVLV